MLDPLIYLAFSANSYKGIYALLLGSGVSTSAGIPTGWEIVKDLIRKVARLQGENCEPDPPQWYREKFSSDPDYGSLLELVAKSPTERSQLLRAYFEPTVEEQEQGRKVPTEAHRAIASLASRGHIRVIVTTNFDRLIERALDEGGVTPTVISSGDSAEGAMPLQFTKCTVIKVHGDYMDTRIRNTPGELAEFDARMNALLDRVFDEFGLIVCGWSAEWDTALRNAIERCKSRRFTTYWTRIGEPRDSAKRLIRLRQAQEIPIRSADVFFHDLSEKITALEDFDRPNPLSTKMATATVKRYLAEERYFIPLNDLVSGETERVYQLLSRANFPVQSVSYTAEELKKRLRKYEAIMEVLLAMSISGCYWGKKTHIPIWVKILQRIGNPPGDFGGVTGWLKLELYPAMLLWYASGLSSVSSGNYAMFSALFTDPQYRRDGEPRSLCLDLIPTRVVEPDTMRAVLNQNIYTPVSDHVFDVLREPFREYLPDDEEYARMFDRFEYLFGLVYADVLESRTKEIRGPIGRFGWRRQYQYDISKEVNNEVEKEVSQWQPIQSGLFRNSPQRFKEIKAKFDTWVNERVAVWH